jgi:hypothetical protein
MLCNSADIEAEFTGSTADNAFAGSMARLTVAGSLADAGQGSPFQGVLCEDACGPQAWEPRRIGSWGPVPDFAILEGELFDTRELEHASKGARNSPEFLRLVDFLRIRDVAVGVDLGGASGPLPESGLIEWEKLVVVRLPLDIEELPKMFFYGCGRLAHVNLGDCGRLRRIGCAASAALPLQPAFR